jgi:tetratricopeptide (TPR) repeat protein
MSATAPAVVSSEEVFRKGLATLERKSYQQAVSLFQEAIELERLEGSKTPRMKYVSFLGLSLTLANGRSEEGIKLCLQAVKREFFDPDLYCNLGIVYLRNRQKGPAFEAFQKGLNISPRNPRIRDTLERYDRRGDPVISFLPRSHPVNRLAGAVRQRLRALFTRDSDAD